MTDEAPMTTKHRLEIQYVVYAKVLSVKWQNNPDGYFAHFEGSWESINFGVEPPHFEAGDIVKITFKRHNPE